MVSTTLFDEFLELVAAHSDQVGLVSFMDIKLLVDCMNGLGNVEKKRSPFNFRTRTVRSCDHILTKVMQETMRFRG